MAAVELFADQPSTVVSSGGTTNSDTSFTVATPGAFPQASNAATPPTQFHICDANPAKQSEIMTVTNVSGSTWTVTRGAEGTTAVAHGAGWTAVQVVTSGYLSTVTGRYFGYPWQFYPENFGAAGDGKIGTGGTGTSGTSTFTDSGASFVNATAPAGDVGKIIVINQGTAGSGTQMGTAQNPFCGTITAVNSATSVTLNTTLAATCTAAPYVYGTDNSTAIQAAINAAATYAEANGQYAEVLLGSAIYMLAGLTQTLTAGADYNTHLAIPSPAQTGQRLTLRIKGVGIPYNPYWEEETVQLSGSCLVSGIFPPDQPDPTYGQMSVIGSTVTQPGGTAFANTLLSVDDVSIIVPWNSQIYGVDGRNIDQLEVPHGLCKAFAPVNVPQASIGGPYLQRIPTNGVSVGYAFPVVNNNDVSHSLWLSVLGMSKGVACSEHTNITKLITLYCDQGLWVWPNGGAVGKHVITVQHWSVEGCNTCLDASASTGGTQSVNIGLMDGETNNTAHVNDPDNILTGIIYWNEFTSSNVVNTGAVNVTVIDTDKHLPGPWSGAPAAPVSGTAQQNLAYRYATIYISADTSITSFAVGPTSSSMTAVTVGVGANVVVPVRVMPGWYWKWTGSGTLTASWVLD